MTSWLRDTHSLLVVCLQGTVPDFCFLQLIGDTQVELIAQPTSGYVSH